MAQPQKSQYQHYIPQFLLREFAHDEENDKPPGSFRFARHYRNDSLLCVIDLRKHTPLRSFCRVRKTFGQTNMYKNDTKAKIEDQMQVEVQLGKIENEVSRIIKRVITLHRANCDSVELSCKEKDKLKRFLFLMNFRGQDYFQRYNHQSIEGYRHHDREDLSKYMSAQSLLRPIDVWFHSLSEIMDADITPNELWISELSKRIYPPHASLLGYIMLNMYLVLCTPAACDEEFIITNNAFNTYEKPISYQGDGALDSDATLAGVHAINIVSPRLVLLLRSNTFNWPQKGPNGEELPDRNWVFRQIHGLPYYQDIPHPILEDFGIKKPMNSFQDIVDGRATPKAGYDGILRHEDKYWFQIYRLESGHVQLINSLILDHACPDTKIVFKTEESLLKALEFYLSMPHSESERYNLKSGSKKTRDPRKILLAKLHRVALSLGSSKKAFYYHPKKTLSQFALAVAHSLEDFGNQVSISQVERTLESKQEFLCGKLMSMIITELGVDVSDIEKDDQKMASVNPQESSSIFPVRVLSTLPQIELEGKELLVDTFSRIPEASWISSWDSLCHDSVHWVYLRNQYASDVFDRFHPLSNSWF